MLSMFSHLVVSALNTHLAHGTIIQHPQMYIQSHVNIIMTCVVCIPCCYLCLQIGDCIVAVFFFEESAYIVVPSFSIVQTYNYTPTQSAVCFNQQGVFEFQELHFISLLVFQRCCICRFHGFTFTTCNIVCPRVATNFLYGLVTFHTLHNKEFCATAART